MIGTRSTHAVIAYGTTLVEGPDRIGEVTALGLDEVLFARLGKWRTQHWSTQLVDVHRGQLLDVVSGRNAAGPCAWLAERGERWCGRVEFATLDLSGPYRRVFDTMTPTATQVADPFHLVKLANQKLDEVRRRVQNETLGHRGHKNDPLYRSRRLLTKADERLEEKGRTKLMGLLDAGDPRGEVRMAWHAKEVVRGLYEHHDPDLALEFVTRLGRDLQDRSCPPEVRQLGRAILRWRHQIAAWHQAHVSNGPTEAANNLLKRVKRAAFGFTSSGTTGSAPSSTPASPTGISYRPSLPGEIRRAVKPLECVVFMRMVRSRNLFEQMKGRGVRVASATDMAVTPDAGIKDRFVLVDAVGVTEANLNDTVPLDRKKAIGFDKLLQKLAYDRVPDLEVVSSIAARIARLERRISQVDRQELETVAGMSLEALAHQLVDAIDPDLHHAQAQRTTGRSDPTVEEIRTAAAEVLTKAVEPLRDNAELRTKLVEIRRSYEQLIDEFTKDRVTLTTMSSTVARNTVDSFRAYIEEHKDEITALQVLYSRPYVQRITYTQIKELASAIGRPPHRWTPEQLWAAYEQLDGSKVRGSGNRVLTDIVSLVRYALGQEDELVAYPDLVNKRFTAWLAQQTQAGVTYSADQLSWLEAIRDHIAASLDITTDDFEYTPFSDQGGIGRAVQLFPDLAGLLGQLTEALAA